MSYDVETNKDDKYKKDIFQFIRFCIVGLSNVIISYFFFVIVIRSGGHYILANFIGYVSGTISAFVWNNIWVFKADVNEKRNIPVALLKTFVSYASTGLILNSILLVLWIRILHIPQIIAPIINSAITLSINFLSNKFWIFKKNN